MGLLHKRHERSKQRGAWQPAAVVAMASSLLFSPPASASVRITYSASSGSTISDIVTANLDIADGLTLDQTGQTLAAPAARFTDPHSWSQTPRGVMLMGERQDILGNLHLVLGVSPFYADGLVGRSFSSLFPMLNEHLVLGSLELISDNVLYDPALQTLSGISRMVINNGGAFDPDGAKFTLISFSDGEVIGSGKAFLESSPPIASAVPESASWTMMMIGFGLVGSMLRGIGADRAGTRRGAPRRRLLIRSLYVRPLPGRSARLASRHHGLSCRKDLRRPGFAEECRREALVVAAAGAADMI